MKGLMISSLSSGSGKTLFTSGLIRLLKNNELNVLAAKTGPDYIDTQYHSLAAGDMSQNLDMHLQGKDGMKKSLGLKIADYLVVEGAMGYYDGIYNTYKNSSYEIAKELNIDTILVYSIKGEMFSLIPKLKGFVDFSGNRIKGIVLNKTSKAIHDLIKPKIEEYVGIKVLGYIEEKNEFEIKSRHLGLFQSGEVKNCDSIIEMMAENIKSNIDIEYILSLFKDVEYVEDLTLERRNMDVCIMKDVAFSFYYRENLNLLEKTCNVHYVSPLRDEEIPKCDFLYIGGGYPEVFKHELSINQTMLSSVKSYADNNGYIYAECGGLMYLCDEIDGEKMVGVFNGKSYMTNRLQNFGYNDIELIEDFLIGDKGEKFNGHEFHRSLVEIEDKRHLKINKTMGNREWKCGYRYKNTVAMYPHISFLGNLEAFNKMLDKIEGRTKI